MSNRIESGSTQPTTTTYEDTQAEGATEASKTESSEKAAGTESTGEPMGPVADDVWEESEMSNYDDVVGRGADPSEGGYASVNEVEGAMEVWELMGTSAVPSADVAEDSFDLNDDPAASLLANHFDQFKDDNMGPGEIRREFDAIMRSTSTGVSSHQLEQLVHHRDELRSELSAQFGDASYADAVVSGLERQSIIQTAQTITNRARPVLEAAMEGLDQINANSDTRRVFLATVATESESEAEIATALNNFGLSSSTAEDMAEMLNEVRTNPELRQAFIDGDKGDVTGLFNKTFTRAGDFERLENDFESELDSARQGLESLHKQAGSNEIDTDKFLTDPRLASVRDEVLADKGAVMDPAGDTNQMGEMFLEAIGDSEASQTKMRLGIAVANIAGSLAATVATGGLAGGALVAAGVGAATTAAAEVPGIAEAKLNADMAQAAVHADFADPALIEKAKGDQQVAYAMAAANVVVSGGSSALGTMDVAGADQADFTSEAFNVGKEIHGAGGD